MILALSLLAAALPVSIAGSSLVFFPLLSVFLLGARWTFPKFPVSWMAIERVFLGFFFLGALSALGGLSPLDSRHSLFKDLYFLVFVLTGALARTAEERWQVLRVFLLWSVLSAALGLLQFALGIIQTDHHSRTFERLPSAMRHWPPLLLEYVSTIQGRAVGTRSHPITYAEGLLLGLAAVFGAWRAFPTEWRRWNIYAAFLIGGIMASQSRGPWLAMGLVLTAAVFFTGRRFWWTGGLLLGIPLAMWFISPALRNRTETLSDPHYRSNSERVRMWKAGLEMTRDHPWLGVGPGNVKRAVSFYQEDADKREGPWGHLHNTFIHILAERGIPSLLAFLTLMGVFLRSCWRGLRQPQDQIQGLAMTGILAILAFLACGFTERAYGDTEIVMIFYFLLGLAVPRFRASGFITIPPR